MLILIACIDGQTTADLASGLRETLRQLEAGQVAGEDSTPQKSYHFKVSNSRLPQDDSNSAPAPQKD